ncbi:uncharacterized protein CXorf65 homolog [Aptenodytes patagonicus]|uniref:uncharacterized protein CXorf65 homolog n=1 Tax=Aptenodytes patagonicus TaxID=9234 RepID=UPI003FA00043
MFIYIKHGDDQSFLANTNCAVLWLLSYVRRMVGVPDTDVINLCDKLATPKLLFQVTRLSERASELLQVRSTYYVCRVEFGAPGTEEEDACWSFMPLLEHPSPTLAVALRLQGEHLHRRQTGTPDMPEERRTPDAETLPSTAQSQGMIRGCWWPPGRPPPTPRLSAQGKAPGQGPGRESGDGEDLTQGGFTLQSVGGAGPAGLVTLMRHCPNPMPAVPTHHYPCCTGCSI